MVARKVDVHERLPLLQTIPLSLQHLFAMFGATILVPKLTGLDPAVALFTSGIGTLIYILCVKARVPAYLGSSFAFIAPIIAVAEKSGHAYAMGGAAVAGLVYVAVAGIIYRFGTAWIDKLLPPVVVGSVVMVIGLALAQNAVEMASADLGVALVTLAVAVSASVFFKGFLAVIPVLIGIVGGYTFALAKGIVDLSPIVSAGWAGMPNFLAPKFSLPAVLLIAPVAVVTITEHIGHLLVTNNVVGRDFTKDPGLHRSILGDGLATSAAALFGGPPNTTYGENIGVMAITRVYSVWVIGWAAVIAILLSFIPKVGMAIQTIPAPVLGGISILLFGVIASSGIRMLVEAGIDFADKRNLIIASVVLILGIGGAKVSFGGGFELHGMSLATIVGVLLNLVLPKTIAHEEGAQQES